MKIRPVQTEAVALPPTTITSKAPSTVASQATGDSYQPAQNQKLVNMLQEQPDIRPDALERAKSLAADPNYPSAAIVAKLAKLVISSAKEE
jgi:hypothetical protein